MTKLSSEISHGNDALPCKGTVLTGLWAAISRQDALHAPAQRSSAHSPAAQVGSQRPQNPTSWRGAWSNLPSPIKGLSNELICRNLRNNFYTKLLLIFPTQVLRQK